MPEIVGRLRTPRLANAPANPVLGEVYYDTSLLMLYCWNGTIWVGASGGVGPPGTPGAVQVYQQTAEPVGASLGAIWITSEPPPVGIGITPLDWGDLIGA